MRKKPNIFIISSGRALGIATQLRLELDNGDFENVWLWSEDSKKSFGERITDVLVERAKTADFALVLLTRDDALLKKGNNQQAARDNCIFEAGLFTGALDLDFKRCILVCALKDDEVPSDLKEIIHLKIEEPPEALLDDPEACSNAIKPLLASIRLRAQRMPLLSRQFVKKISKEELLEKEQFHPKGNLVRGSVVVNSTQPMEQGYAFAKRVLQNLTAGAHYHYFFYANPKGYGADFVCQLVQMFTLVDFLNGTEEPKERLAIMEAKSQEVTARLQNLSERMSIHFISYKAPLQFCVHNADDADYGKCYLRYGDDFIEWCVGQPAVDIADSSLGTILEKHPKVLFRSTTNCDLFEEKNNIFTERLRQGLRQHFSPSLRDTAKDVCLMK